MATPVFQLNARNAGLNAIIALMNGGTLKVCDSATVLFTFTFGATAFKTSTTGSTKNNAFTADAVAAVAAGDADNFKCYTSGAALVLTGTVATSGAHLNLTNTAYNIDDTLTIEEDDITITLPESV